MELLPQISAVISVIVGTGGVTIVICIGLWLLFCRWVIDSAAKRGEKPDPRGNSGVELRDDRAVAQGSGPAIAAEVRRHVTGRLVK